MSDDITRAIDWVGCTTNSPAHTHEIRTDALKALADLRAERDEQKRRADYLSKDFDRDIKMYQADVAELRADLAAAKLSHIEAVRKLTKTIADLQNELAAANAELAVKEAVGYELNHAVANNRSLNKHIDVLTTNLAAADARAEDAEARERELLKDLNSIMEDCEADYPPSPDAIKYSICDAIARNKNALNKGETDGQG